MLNHSEFQLLSSYYSLNRDQKFYLKIRWSILFLIHRELSPVILDYLINYCYQNISTLLSSCFQRILFLILLKVHIFINVFFSRVLSNKFHWFLTVSTISLYSITTKPNLDIWNLIKELLNLLVIKLFIQDV